MTMESLDRIKKLSKEKIPIQHKKISQTFLSLCFSIFYVSATPNVLVQHLLSIIDRIQLVMFNRIVL